ncbi:MAG: hypothetical protein WCA81_17545 [Rhizomicrobium sp.]
MRRLFFLALAGAVVFCTTASYGSPKPHACQQLRFEPRQNISTREFHQLSAQNQAVPGSDFVYWWFDYEDYPEKNGWYGVAFVEAASGDLGETPVAGILWSSKQIETQNDFQVRTAAQPDKLIPRDGVSIIFEATVQTKGCPSASLILSQRGEKIYADGKFVGTIKDF